MDSATLRKKFLAFFEAKGHKVIPSASLIPENDPTVLFTTAGMHPLVPYLLGEKHPQGARLVNVQKCVRTGDIESVGDPWHLTFFEMLGNWSLGDYFKKEAIEMAWEFLTSKKWLGIDPKCLSVSVFAGDCDAPRDSEAANIWKKVGIGTLSVLPEKRIYFYPKSENWWGPAGEIGPCGPDTEIFFDTGKDKCGEQCEPRCKCGKYVEIWNLVFMEYNKRIKNQESRIKGYEYVPLGQKNVDTGMGLERTVAILNGYTSVYETDLFAPIIDKIKNQKSKIKNTNQNSKINEIKASRIIADHIKAAVMILGDEKGIAPSNKDQGYVLRRLIRRAVLYTDRLGIKQDFMSELADSVIKIYQDIYPALEQNRDFVQENLGKEEKKFKQTLKRGSKEFKKWYTKPEVGWIASTKDLQKLEEKAKKSPKIIPGDVAFRLYTTYGFPVELIKEIATEKGLQVDEKSFREKFKKHQELSRTASAGMFKGGLADASETTIKYHTATHLLQAALRQVLGKHVEQRGSNITPERLRFDFSHPCAMTAERIKKVEEIVNQKIQEKLPVTCTEMTPDEAKGQGAIGLFGHKYGEYGDRVKVYSIGNFSKEICGGPHIKNTGELGEFEIIKEEAVSAGVRRIKAVLK